MASFHGSLPEVEKGSCSLPRAALIDNIDTNKTSHWVDNVPHADKDAKDKDSQGLRTRAAEANMKHIGMSYTP